MIYRGIDNMYEAKVSNKIIINHETGAVKLEEFGVNVDGYSNPKQLSEAIESYNSGKEISSDNREDNSWPKGDWYHIYFDMLERLFNWKRKPKDPYKKK
jgi:hypothetical protein